MDEYGFDNYAGYEMESAYQPVNPYDFEEEERRKEELRRQLEEAQKQQEELASEVSRKEEITEYGDGSRTVKTTREIPAGGKIQPAVPTDYNARIAQQESGSRPDIGFHDQSKSSAYGTYGLTNAAYQDARRIDPTLPEDIRQATPEQQTQAQNAFTQQNARYLQNLGIEPTPNNLAAAHFLGAKGLSDFLRTGQISEAAARANGGADNVRRIVNQRLSGQAAPASGAATLVQGEQGGMPTQKPRPQPISPEQAQAQAQAQSTMEGGNAGQGIRVPGMGQTQPGAEGSKPFIERYQADQNDPNALMKLSTDTDAPDWMKDRARNRAADLITQQREMQAAQEKVSTMTESELAKAMREKTTGGSWVKAIFYSAIGAKSLAQAEGAKLGLGTDKTVMGADGKSYMVKVAANGTPLEGYSAETGKKLSAEELVNAVGGAANPAAQKKDIVGGTYVNDKTGEVGRVVSDPRTGVSFVQTDSGRRPMAGFRPQGQGGTMDMQKAQQIQRQNIDLAGDWAKLQMKVQGAAPEAANKFIGEFNAKHGTNFGIQSISGNAPQISMETGQMMQPAQTAPQAAPTQTAAAPAAQAAQAAPTQAPTQGRVTAFAPVAPTMSTTTKPAALTPVTPADIESQREQAKKDREAGLEVQTAEQKDFVTKTKPEVGTTASDGLVIANARRQQLDVIKNNPSIINIMNGQGTTYDQARRIMINAVSGAYGREERQELSNDLSQVLNKLTEGEQAALQEFVNINTVVNAKTLRANAGPGAVSEAEQRANKEANVGNIDRIPAYAALSGLNRSQFTGDLAASKQAFMQANPQLKTTGEFNSAWQKQESLRLKEYQAIAKARFDVMGKAPAPNASPEAIKAYRDRVFRAFEAYPAPTYDPNTNKWNYQTANARRAAMAAVLGQ